MIVTVEDGIAAAVPVGLDSLDPEDDEFADDDEVGEQLVEDGDTVDSAETTFTPDLVIMAMAVSTSFDKRSFSSSVNAVAAAAAAAEVEEAESPNAEMDVVTDTADSTLPPDKERSARLPHKLL